MYWEKKKELKLGEVLKRHKEEYSRQKEEQVQRF